ncbi:Regulator of protease activity HflC, stomatin/prohibitin superfamily [Ruminobacter amylophilus]|uniref:Regulator of protease activity HflC, stomatin/prohibitin superfamily n=1 Tax=Ruminobacter amylophilus TaxID=867 RepID=A0A662ZI02_9GAMM|nr:prohibitin family protein [Ruminobacter amylophilus]SFP48591.1 Regulator of protease activity HflC, stomatin/prohibitin superfamily [Ruminobacter amylophilus]
MSQVSHSSGHGRGFTFAAVIGAAIIFFVVFFFAELFYTVNASMVGVVLSGGKISSVSQPGMHSKVPFYQQVKFIDLKSNSGSVKTEAYTFDQQNATLKINVIWNFVGTKAEDIYVNYKGDEKYIYEYVIAPKLIDCAKTIFGQYNAEKVIQKRAEFVNLLNTQFKELMTDIPVQIRSVQVEDISFSKVYETSVENAMKARADVEKAKAELERVQLESQQKVKIAEAESEAVKKRADAQAYAILKTEEANAAAIRLRGEALRENSEIVRLTVAEKWDGKLPSTMVPGSSLPFIDVKSK